MKTLLRNENSLVLAIMTLTFLAYLIPQLLVGDINRPPVRGDGPDYDAIALQLSKGNGFSVHWTDPDYLSPYRDDPGYAYLFQRREIGSTAYRPPLLPLLMAGCYRLFGREFAPIRALNCLAWAITCGIVFKIVASHFGQIPALLTFMLFMADPRPRFYSQHILTESLAAMFVALLVWSMLRLQEERTWSWTCLAGAASGLGMLTRNIVLLWMPILIVVVFQISGGNWREKSRMAASFTFFFLALATPFMIRNCLVLGRFMPLGTQGAIQMSAMYSDKTLADEGRWFGLDDAFWSGNQSRRQGLNNMEREREKAEYSQSLALQWMAQHPRKMVPLFFCKLRGLWQLSGTFNSFVLVATLASLLLAISRKEMLILASILIANSIAVGLTYYDGDRFLVPTLPVMFIIIGAGIFVALQRLRPLANSQKYPAR